MNRLQKEAKDFRTLQRLNKGNLANTKDTYMEGYYRGKIDAYRLVADSLEAVARQEPDYEEEEQEITELEPEEQQEEEGGTAEEMKEIAKALDEISEIGECPPLGDEEVIGRMYERENR